MQNLANLPMTLFTRSVRRWLSDGCTSKELHIAMVALAGPALALFLTVVYPNLRDDHPFYFTLLNVSLAVFSAFGVFVWTNPSFLDVAPEAAAHHLRWDKTDSCWHVTGHIAARQLLDNPFLSANSLPSQFAKLTVSQRAQFFPVKEFFSRWPVFQNGIVQKQTHACLASLFNEKQVTRCMQPVIRDVLAAVLNQCVKKNGKSKGFDLVHDYANVATMHCVCLVLGFPSEMAPKLKHWTEQVDHWFNNESVPLLERFENVQTTIDEFSQCTQALLDGGPRPGSVMEAMALMVAPSGVVPDQFFLEREDLIPNLLFLASANVGSFREATSSLVSNGLLALIDHPEQRDALESWLSSPEENSSEDESDAFDIDRAMDELLRFCSPVKRVTRIVLESIKFKGHVLEQGQTIHFHISDANIDPDLFSPDPTVLDLSRRNKFGTHMALGAGPHSCIGSILCKCVSVMAIINCLQQFPDLKLKMKRSEVTYAPSKTIKVLSQVSVHSAKPATFTE